MKHEILNISTRGHGDIIDLGEGIRAFLSRSDAEDGLLSVFVPGSTAGITTVEYESGVLEDLEALLERLAPSDAEYRHNLRWGDGNGFSHLRAALLGPSLCIPIFGGLPALGTWQQIVLVECDNRSRQRQVRLSLLEDRGN